MKCPECKGELSRIKEYSEGVWKCMRRSCKEFNRLKRLMYAKLVPFNG